MIQRIQSVFLALVIGIYVALLFIPVYKIKTLTNVIKGSPSILETNYRLSSIPLLSIAMACVSLVALIAIFSYKNRKRQIRICRIGAVISILISANALVFPQFYLHGVDHSVLLFGIGAYLLPVNIILFALAARFIKKDDDLVRAADRLR
jgi:hypothetical protein